MSQAIEDIQKSVRTACDASAPLRIKGRGTWSHAYRHPSAASELSLWNYAGVQEYVPGNLTMTVRAGTTLGEIAEIAGAENQWLPLDPFGDSAGTIGATIATCSHGPLATGFGTPRDLVLGVEAILGSGEIVRGGGRVVKNVAGYDLSRLFTGSWGTIGAITEISLRLFAKQESESSIAVLLPDSRDSAARLIREIRSAPIYPWAMELVDSRLASWTGLGTECLLVFRFGGNRNVVNSQIEQIAALGNSRPVTDAFWSGLSAFPHAWSMRLSGLPSKLLDTWEAAGRLVADAGSGFRTATLERGSVRIFFPSEVDPGMLFTTLAQFAGTAHTAGVRVIIEAMPSLSPLSSSAGDRAVANELSRGVKGVFDPKNILNPGFLPQ